MSVAQRLERIRETIAAACSRAGRDPKDVGLLAVSKLQPAELVEEAYAAGQRDFGENYVQELLDKRRRLAHLDDIRWHFIGHLQTNKAKQVADSVAAFHALDSERLARELAGRLTNPLPVFVQVNIDSDPAKSGVSIADAPKLVDVVRSLPTLTLRGLMCIPRVQPYPEMTRPSFHRLAELARTLGPVGDHKRLQLSMGMSSDLEIAVEEGADLVRVGTLLFGERVLAKQPER